MTDYHPMDKQILSLCKIDLASEKVKEDYRRLRQIMTWTGQVGQIPVPSLYSLVLRHGDFSLPVAKTEEPDPQPQPKTK